MRTLSVAMLLAIGCSGNNGPTSITLQLSQPAAISLPHPAHAFVDRTYPQWWYFASDAGEGDNPSDPSPTRITFTMLGDHEQIDNYVHADMYFRAPSFPECVAFTGTLSRSGDLAKWRVDINAFCTSLGYPVVGYIEGSN